MRRSLFRVGPSAGSSGAAGLSTGALAPMVDLFTLLIVAVLRTWSAEPPTRTPEGDLDLPISRAEDAPERGVVVDVGKDGLYVDGWRAGSSAYWATAESVLVTDLYAPLQQRAGEKTVVIRAHAEAPWQLVGKVLLTAQQAGFEEVSVVAESAASL
jgi:biopolymer transport protein ExbD